MLGDGMYSLGGWSDDGLRSAASERRRLAAGSEVEDVEVVRLCCWWNEYAVAAAGCVSGMRDGSS